jgi:hypothetical protein
MNAYVYDCFDKEIGSPGADALNIYGLLNPKKLENFKNWML